MFLAELAIVFVYNVVSCDNLHRSEMAHVALKNSKYLLFFPKDTKCVSYFLLLESGLGNPEHKLTY